MIQFSEFFQSVTLETNLICFCGSNTSMYQAETCVFGLLRSLCVFVLHVSIKNHFFSSKFQIINRDEDIQAVAEQQNYDSIQAYLSTNKCYKTNFQLFILGVFRKWQKQQKVCTELFSVDISGRTNRIHKGLA